MPVPVLPPKPEILSPAGNWQCAVAAVENGADAIYFGASRFNARARADNFTLRDIPKLMEMLHRRGVRGYLTFNILVFTDELEAAKEELRALIEAKVDAAIVQDVGLFKLIRSLSPDFPIHASTQMTISSAAGLAQARELGASLCVLCRENTLDEISAMRQAQTDMPLEVFVHGALCVAYSGQCLTSEALGGRSANRGECAQACRMPYTLVCDDKTIDLGDKRYLLSPRDLAGISLLPELIKRGVRSLKTEGRLKSAEYVANITRAYRAALDLAYEKLSRGQEVSPEELYNAHAYDLQMGFSRGLYTGWMQGINNRELVHARFGMKRGVYLGEVAHVQAPHVFLRLEADVKAGDGVVFDAGRPDLGEEGARVHEVIKKDDESVLRFARENLDWDKIRAGQKLWKTNDPALDRELRQTFTVNLPRFTRPVSFRFSGKADEPLFIEILENNQVRASACSAMPLVPAQKRPLTKESLSETFSRLGGTPLHLEKVDCRLQGDLILPVSELNRLRRELVEACLQAREDAVHWTLLPDAPLPLPAKENQESQAAPTLIALVRSTEQLEGALEEGVKIIYADCENPKNFRELVKRAHETGAELWAAPPRIFKPNEEWILKQIASAEPDGILVRNAEHFSFFKNFRLRGDFSLNIANPLSAEFFMTRYKLESVTASYDLNIAQLTDLLRTAPAQWFEITLHQHMPLFHMEHCVFCSFLSQGKDFHDCGRPCEKHSVRLRDKLGFPHPLSADAGCRNTLFHARAQTGAEFATHLMELGARRFRVEFLDEDKTSTAQTLHHYRDLLDGKTDGDTLWKTLKLSNQLGVTRGTLGAHARS